MKTNVEVLSQACVRESAWMDHPQVVLGNDLWKVSQDSWQ